MRVASSAMGVFVTDYPSGAFHPKRLRPPHGISTSSSLQGAHSTRLARRNSPINSMIAL